jgi:hypothetical protein
MINIVNSLQVKQVNPPFKLEPSPFSMEASPFSMESLPFRMKSFPFSMKSFPFGLSLSKASYNDWRERFDKLNANGAVLPSGSRGAA